MFFTFNFCHTILSRINFPNGSPVVKKHAISLCVCFLFNCLFIYLLYDFFSSNTRLDFILLCHLYNFYDLHRAKKLEAKKVFTDSSSYSWRLEKKLYSLGPRQAIILL